MLQVQQEDPGKSLSLGACGGSTDRALWQAQEQGCEQQASCRSRGVGMYALWLGEDSAAEVTFQLGFEG